jgi:hypothetical protein
MNAITKVIVFIVLSLFAALGAKADNVRSEDVQAAKLVICGTVEKAQQFAVQNQDIQAAIAADNETSTASASCLVAGIAYVSGKQMDRVRNKDGAYAVTEILIVGVETPYGFLAIEPSVVYTLIKVDEEKA